MSKLFNWAAARLAAAFALALPLAAMAVTTVGYTDFGDVAGVQLWRTATDSGVTDFAFAKFAAVAADGTVGETYTQGSSSADTHWRRWASKYNNGDNSAYYTAPGLVLVYDQAGLMATPSKGATFAPLSFGGLWVKELGANDTPYGLTDEANKGRVTEFGATGCETLFKFEKSFTINRGAASTFYGTATVNITGDAVFTASTGYATVVDADATLKLTGDSTAAMSVGTGLTVNGTLDLTATTLPTISGNVRFAGGSSLVLPAGVATGEAISVPVCSGTLTADGVVSVKIGTADPINAALTISGGTIMQIDETVVEQTFASDYPSVIPAGYIYTFTTSAATTLPDVTVNGTLKTKGDFTITDLKVAAGGALEVVSGNTTVGGAATCQIKGNVTVDADATLTNTLTDSLDYNGSMTVDVYGTLAMGSTRWSIPSGCTFKLHGGAQVTGVGDSLAALDIINASGSGLDVYAANGGGTVTIEGPVRVRANETRIWVEGGTTLVLSRGVVQNNGHTGSFRQTGPGTLRLDATSTTLTGTSIMTQGTLRLNNTTQAFPLALQGNNSHLEIVATSAETIVPVNVTSIANNNVALTGNGKANGTITKTAAPSGNLATFLQSSAWEGTFVADWAGAYGTRFDINSYGNANSTVRVTKLVGGYVSGSNANVTVVPTVEVSGFMTLDNGYSGKVTTLTKLTGSGVFTNTTYSVDVTTLDNFTGTLATLISTQYIGMRIGTINLSSTPAAGAKIVNITSDSNIGNIGNTKVSVNGVVDDTIALEVKSDGIYVAVPVTTVDITIPEVANATVSVTADGVAVTPVNGVVTVDIGAAVIVTYTAAEGYQLTGDAISFTASASTTTVDVSSISVAAIVANVTSADGQTTTPYTSAASAIAAADKGETVTLLETTVTLTEVVAINKSITILSGNASGTTITGLNTSAYPTLGAADLTLGANVTVSAQLRVLSGEATITHPTGKAPSYRPPSGYMSSSKNNGDDTTTITFYQQIYVIAAGTNATLADENGNLLGSYTPVASGDTFVFTVTPAAGCALVRVTADGVELTPSEGKYSISIGSSDVSIYAVAGVAVVTGGDSDVYCSSLQAAVDAATSGQTVTLLADDHVSFSLDNLEIAISKALTIDGAGYTVYGVNDYAYDGVHDHDIYISGSGDVTIKNVTLANFAGGVGNNMRTYPIWTGQAYEGTLTLDNVTVQNFNRTAFNLNGGTVVVTNCTITGDTTKEAYFQEGIGVYNANVTIVDTAISNVGSNLEKEDSQIAACIQLGNPNGSATGTGSITVVNGTYSGEYGIIVASNAQNTVSVQGGTFVGGLMVEEGEGGNIAVSGGTFDAAVPAEYCAEGYEPTDDGEGNYTVRIDMGWIYEASGIYKEYTGTWSNEVEYADGKAHIEDGNTYTANRPSDGRMVTVEMTLSFDDVNDEDETVGDAKAAVKLATGGFKVYTSEGPDGAVTSVWKSVTIEGSDMIPVADQDYKFLFVLDLTNTTYTAALITSGGAATNALLLADGGVANIPFASRGNVAPVQKIEFIGSGSVTSIEGSYEDVPVPEGFVEDEVVTLAGDDTATLTAAQATWLNQFGVKLTVAARLAELSSAQFTAAYLLNLDIMGTFSYTFNVTGFGFETVNETECAVVTVTLTRTGALTENEKAKPIVGTLKLKGTATLGTEFTVIDEAAVADDDFSEGNTTTITLDKGDAKFFQPVIE